VQPFQLDESCSAKHLIRSCTSEAKCDVRPFPNELRGKKDWEWFPVLLATDAPIVSTDFTIAFEEQNIRAIPSPASGILVVRPKYPTSGFGSKQASPILSAFKAVFPPWSEIDWSDTYVEITEVDVTVRNLARAAEGDGHTIQISDPDLVPKLQDTIAAARRPPHEEIAAPQA
jgi:hypothetical protein